ncbi:IMPACT family protein [Mycoplasmopsis adleri]|uniref:IMPACT family protein n=1 Tax=Mycoplasmopsis adleri TaxID=51362 RepID=UPI003873942E
MLEPQLYEVKKSKFYSYLFEIDNKEQIKELFTILKKEHPKANHICSAYLLKDDNYEASGFDDNKEPSGSAGRPIQNLIKIRNLKNIVVFVVRYFGGIELGFGGLQKAYRKSANLAIDAWLNTKNK